MVMQLLLLDGSINEFDIILLPYDDIYTHKSINFCDL